MSKFRDLLLRKLIPYAFGIISIGISTMFFSKFDYFNRIPLIILEIDIFFIEILSYFTGYNLTIKTLHKRKTKLLLLVSTLLFSFIIVFITFILDFNEISLILFILINLQFSILGLSEILDSLKQTFYPYDTLKIMVFQRGTYLLLFSTINFFFITQKKCFFELLGLIIILWILYYFFDNILSDYISVHDKGCSLKEILYPGSDSYSLDEKVVWQGKVAKSGIKLKKIRIIIYISLGAFISFLTILNFKYIGNIIFLFFINLISTCILILLAFRHGLVISEINDVEYNIMENNCLLRNTVKWSNDYYEFQLLNFYFVDKIIIRPIRLLKNKVAHIDFYSKTARDQHFLMKKNTSQKETAKTWPDSQNYFKLRFYYVNNYDIVKSILLKFFPESKIKVMQIDVHKIFILFTVLSILFTYITIVLMSGIFISYSPIFIYLFLISFVFIYIGIIGIRATSDRYKKFKIHS